MLLHNVIYLCKWGGTDKIRYEVSATYQNQEGIIILSTGQRRLNLRGNLDIQVSSKFKVELIFNTSNWNRKWKKGVLIMDRFLGLLIYAPIFRLL